ncbi:Fc receptor-like protein 5 isoform X1, partial [Clarias magur]
MKPQIPVYTGEIVTLTCELKHGTGWEFQWYRNNHQNLGTEQKYTNTLKLTVNNAGETVYRCTARRRNPWTDRYYDTEYSNEVRITAR